MRILVTGAAAFIGYHFIKRLLKEGNIVVSIDNLNNYYDVQLKLGRVCQLEDSEWSSGFKFIKMDLADRKRLQALFEAEQFDIVANFGGQTGVRYSIENPDTYIDNNIMGFLNILECSRHFPVKYLLYSSSSSVYGGNTKVPFSEDDRVDCPHI